MKLIKNVMAWALVLGFMAHAQAEDLTALMCPNQLPVGETFEVALEANASTGYQWQIKQQSAALTLLNDEYQSTQAVEPMMVGVPGQHVWTFQAGAVGEAYVQLVYVRPWQTQEIAKTWECRFPVVAD